MNMFLSFAILTLINCMNQLLSPTTLHIFDLDKPSVKLKTFMKHSRPDTRESF
jgi:hypothetical protein